MREALLAALFTSLLLIPLISAQGSLTWPLEIEPQSLYEGVLDTEPDYYYYQSFPGQMIITDFLPDKKARLTLYNNREEEILNQSCSGSLCRLAWFTDSTGVYLKVEPLEKGVSYSLVLHVSDRLDLNRAEAGPEPFSALDIGPGVWPDCCWLGYGKWDVARADDRSDMYRLWVGLWDDITVTLEPHVLCTYTLNLRNAAGGLIETSGAARSSGTINWVSSAPQLVYLEVAAQENPCLDMMVGSYSLTIESRAGWMAWLWIPIMMVLVGFWYYARKRFRRKRPYPPAIPESPAEKPERGSEF